jgi:DNA-binding transcriptional MocR family regulator
MPRMTTLLQSDDGLLYATLADHLAQAIHSGEVRTGERLPSVRSLATRYHVSISTAVQAYRHLENQRLIEARPKSGYFALRPRVSLPEPTQSKPPQAPRFVTTSTLFVDYIKTFDRPDVVNLGALLPDPTLFPNEKLARILGNVARRQARLAGAYSGGVGEDQLRHAIALRGLENGCRFGAGEVVVTNGCVEALNVCLRAVAKAGDVIALESPTYFIMLQMIESLGMKALEIPTHPRTGISLEAFDLATQKKGAVRALMITPSFSNPLGSLVPEANRRALVQLCEARGIAIIEDDIYGDLHFTGARPLPCKAWDRTGNVLLCSSFSKTLVPGYRLGWAVPGRYFEDVVVLKRIGSVFTAPLTQLAVAEYMESGGFDHQLRKLRKTLSGNADRIGELVAETFPEGTRMTRPEGGYVQWVELPAKINTVDLFYRMRELGIHTSPGALFTSTPRFKNAIRFTLGMEWSRKFEQAIARVGATAIELGK